MALFLVKSDPGGNTISYWRISPEVHFNVVEQVAYAHVMGYKDQDARDADKDASPFAGSVGLPSTIRLTQAAAIAAMMVGDHRPAMYVVAKAMDEFAGAEDVFET
jgi:hypothetical protein